MESSVSPVGREKGDLSVAKNDRLIFDKGESTSSGPLEQFAHETQIFKETNSTRGKQIVLAAVAADSAPFKNGEHAADLMVDMVKQFFTTQIFSEIKSEKDLPGVEIAIRELFSSINIILYNKAMEDNITVRASLSAAFILEGSMFVANVGSSKVLLIRDKNPTSLTRESSWFSQAMKMRGMTIGGTTESARAMDTPFLGEKPNVECDFSVTNLKQGDFVAICTDGVSEFISDQEIQVIISSVPNIPGAAHRLVSIARERGLKDKATALIFRVRPEIIEEKRSIEQIAGQDEFGDDEKKPRGCGCGGLYFYILLFFLIVIAVGTYVGYRYAQKVMHHVVAPREKPTPTGEASKAPQMPETPSGRYFLVRDEESAPLEILRLNRQKLEMENKQYEVFDEHNEMEVLPKIDKGTYSIIITINTRDDYFVYEGSTRNKIRVYEDNVKVNLTKGSQVLFTPHASGGVARVTVSGLKSPTFVSFGKENIILKVELDK